ncbi:type II secretion system F family protein [Clostridium sp. AF32-7AC]|uniref:type II secretion system F family protein n=1 Tax=Clostridium sp. AF32-7AC TaxID=2293010 RepID=UPI0015F7CD3E|nr:type II secretion system F family protein [Clostridium sp. AF32-7AC]
MLGIIVSGAVAVLLIGNFLLCYLRSKGKYDEYMEYVDKEEYGLKDFIPLGLWRSEHRFPESKRPMQLQTVLARHKNTVYQKILEIRGPKDASFYHFIHGGYREAAAILSGAMLSLMGVIFAVQGDSSNGILLSVLAVVAGIGVPFLVDSSLDGDIRKRRNALQMEFPEFVNKLTLLVNAGMTISKAWEKIINENKKEHILYNEMRFALMEIKAGKPEGVAYEEFARRCHVKEITKFVSVIVMNLRRGGSEVVPVLQAQGNECWEMRKNAARQMGEEASTKILIPLMIMFLGIVLIVSTPAVMSMTSGM